MARSATALLLLLFCCASADAQIRPDRIRVSEGVMRGLLIKQVDPQPPADAVRVRGEVVLKAVIDKTGSVESLELISGHPMLVAAAIDAVKQWKFKPYLLNGQVARVETTIRVSFLSQKQK
jgi:protein TonB